MVQIPNYGSLNMKNTLICALLNQLFGLKWLPCILKGWLLVGFSPLSHVCQPGHAWRQFCQSIQQRFGREQHELVIRKLFHIRQTSSIQDYICG